MPTGCVIRGEQWTKSHRSRKEHDRRKYNLMLSVPLVRIPLSWAKALRKCESVCVYNSVRIFCSMARRYGTVAE